MKTKAQEFFESQLITDANSVIDKTRQKYSRMDLIKFAQVFADQSVQRREGEIRKWIKSHCFKDSDVYFISIEEVEKFFSTPTQVEPTQAKQSSLLDEVKRLRDEYNEKVAFLEREIPVLTTARERMYAISMKTMGIEFLLKINDIINNTKP
jgi:hypothetical protein